MSVAFACWAKAVGHSEESAEQHDRADPTAFRSWLDEQRRAFLVERPEMKGWTQATDDFDAWLCAKFAPEGF